MFAAGASVPHAIRWGGVEEPVTVLTSMGAPEPGPDERFRLALADGTVMDVSRPNSQDDWQIDRELGA